ncbi:MAG: hypothetical protein JWQ94_4993 [Tardiphaga sp.]|jgi:hypothetical protein|nr:hypothetical protein [Tardiphaga sp.]
MKRHLWIYFLLVWVVAFALLIYVLATYQPSPSRF